MPEKTITRVEEPVLAFTCRMEGRSAMVQIWPDRLTWRRRNVAGRKVAVAVVTLGISTRFIGLRTRATSTVPIRHITSVSSRKGTGFQTVVLVQLVDRTLSFRVGHDLAARVESVLVSLMFRIGELPEGTVPGAIPPEARGTIGHLERLSRLHRTGDLSDEEFEAAKRKTLDL